MAKFIEQISEPGIIVIKGLTRYEHHNVYVKISNYVSEISLTINDYTIVNFTGDDEDKVNLNAQDETEIINSNGTYSFLIENKRINDLEINYISGVGSMAIYYEGW